MKLVATELMKTVDPQQTVEGMLKFGWTDRELIEAGYAELVADTPDERIATDFAVDVPHLLRVERFASDMLDTADDYNANIANDTARAAYYAAFNALRTEIRGVDIEAGAGSDADKCAGAGDDQGTSVPADRGT